MAAIIEEISNEEFDYIVIGGGVHSISVVICVSLTQVSYQAAGLTVAARLSENPTLSVVVLEAGPANIDDPLIMVPAQFGNQLGNAKYDWFFPTVPQKHAKDRVNYWSRGRMLGGSTAINFYAWNKPPSQDVDIWERLGNPGWNWNRFSEAAKKIERFTPPKEENIVKYEHTYRANAHGYSGPVQTSFPEIMLDCDISFLKTLHNAGIKAAENPLGGNPIGTYMSVSTLDPKSITRSYASTAFYEPNKSRPNLRVLCDALVHRIVTDTSPAPGRGDARAKGVEFAYEGKLHTVRVKRDVILAAGAIKSPQVLELSGIGDINVLRPLGIPAVVDLPGVGRNMQDRLCCSLSFELNPDLGLETLDALKDEKYAALQMELYKKGEGLYRLGLGCYTFVPLSSITPTPEEAYALIARQRERIDRKFEAGELSAALKEQYEAQLKVLESGEGADCELIFFAKHFAATAPEPGKTYISIVAALSHPFSRGTIHVKSNNANDQPEIDPHYFEDEFDVEIMIEIVKYIRRLPQVEPLKSMITKEVAPSPGCTTVHDIEEFVRQNSVTTYHTVGTASMLPRAASGAVDPELLVYGTQNIRVVDLSIIPLEVASHLQSAAYAIGQIAADIIEGKLPE